MAHALLLLVVKHKPLAPHHWVVSACEVCMPINGNQHDLPACCSCCIHAHQWCLSLQQGMGVVHRQRRCGTLCARCGVVDGWAAQPMLIGQAYTPMRQHMLPCAATREQLPLHCIIALMQL